jgi:hypothetical protein
MFRKHGPDITRKQSPPTSPIAESSTSASTSLPTLSLSQEMSETLSDSGDHEHQMPTKHKRKN